MPAPADPSKTQNEKRVDPSIYDRDYFLKTDGADFYSQNLSAPKFLKAAALGKVQTGHRVLDIGCGRGDLAQTLAQAGAEVMAVDYSRDSLVLTQQTLERLESSDRSKIHIFNSDATQLGFGPETMDSIYMVDIAEHLYPEQLAACFDECFRILKPGGRLVVQTSPNKWYNDYGYPLWEQPWNRVLNKVFGQNLLTRPIRNEMDLKVHINEQTPPSLKKSLNRAGFSTRVWLGTEYVFPVKKPSLFAGMLEIARQTLCHAFPLSLFPPLSYLFCNNIWAVALKKEKS